MTSHLPNRIATATATSVMLLAASLGCPTGQRLAAADPDAGARAAAEAYEGELRRVLKTQQSLVDAFQRLVDEDRSLRSRITSSLDSAQRQLREAEHMATLRRVTEPAGEDEDDEPRERIIDLSNTQSAMRANALQLMAMVPRMKAQLGRNQAQLEKLASDAETNRQRLRGLADPWGRRSVEEALRAIAVMEDTLLANPKDDGARTLRALALIRLRRFDQADEELSLLVAHTGPWYDLALAARGYLRIVLQDNGDAARRQKGAVDLNRAVALRSRQAEPFLFRAAALWHQQKWSQAEVDLKSAQRLRPDHIEALRLTALFAAANPKSDAKKLNEAAIAAQRACDLTGSQQAACFEALAAVQARQENWDAAQKTATQAIAVSDPSLAPRLTAQQAAYRDKKLPESGTPLNTTDVPAEVLAGAARAEQDAIEGLRRLSGPSSSLDWRERARYLALCRLWGPAAANMRYVAQFEPLNEPGLLYGLLVALAGDLEEYQSVCRRVAARQTNETAVLLVSVASNSGIAPAEVVRAATQAPKEVPKVPTPDPGYVQALAHYRAGQFAEARAKLQTLFGQIALLPDGNRWKDQGLGVLHQLLALVEAREGNREAAEAAAREASRFIQDQPPKAKELAGNFALHFWLEYQLLKREFTELTAERR